MGIHGNSGSGKDSQTAPTPAAPNRTVLSPSPSHKKNRRVTAMVGRTALVSATTRRAP